MKTATTTTITYRGYSIETEKKPWPLKYGYKFFIGSGDEMKSFTSLEEAKDYIDEKIMLSYPDWKVETFVRQKAADGSWSTLRMPNITKFTWLSDAVKFAAKFDGQLTVNFLNP
jgi:hypothetical protein